MEDLATARERIVRFDGRHADDALGSRPLRRRIPRRVAATRRAGNGPDQAVVASRDAAGVAPRTGGGLEGGWRSAAELRRIRIRPPHHADLPVPDRGRTRRRPAGIRHADALAAGVRRRVDRVRQPYLYEL